MGAEEALELLDSLVFRTTGERLDTAQRIILRNLWEDEKRTYQNIADVCGYTEAHLKSVGAKLWQILSDVLGEKVSKSTFSTVVQRFWKSQRSPTVGGTPSPIKNPILNLVIDNGKSQASDDNFFGRDQEIAELNHLVSRGVKMILIQGEGGVGKTRLARKFFKTQGFYFLDLWMAKESQNIVPVESVVEEWLTVDFNEEPGKEFGINLDRLRRKLRDETRKIGVLIDNLESALDRNGRIIPACRLYVELFRVLADSTSQSITLITSRERLYESGVDVTFYPLEGLDESVWQQFFTSCQIKCNSHALQEMCVAFGGNAKAMQIISGAIITDFERDADVYWRENKNDLLIEPELKNLVASQFDRLEQMDSEAYRLLCRLGCYRYQHITHVSVQGLQCLLWDVLEQQCKRVIKSLSDRLMIEFRKGKYWLHPVICTEAIARLKQSGEWQVANRKAAEFWNDNVTRVENPQDALMALEAYHHYMEISDFEQAANVIISGRKNKWDNSISLGVLFNRLGLLKTLISVIKPLIENLISDYHLNTLYNILGRAYHQIGNITLAIDCHLHANQIAEKYNFFQERISSSFNLGLCYIDLWEVEGAKHIFHSVKNIAATDINYYQYVVYSLCCLAYLDSSVGQNENVPDMLEEAKAGLANDRLTSWGRGTSLLFISLTYKNLGQIETALATCHQAISHCQKNQFSFLEARAISCLASLYREQGEFTVAVDKHLEAIANMNRVSDKCNLAKAYYQLGLTYQKTGNISKSRENFEQAIALFHDMPAPKQVEKVQSAMMRF
ncbi:tetratricopeptide repeat protein [Nostoc sp. TCL26-01]|uniref:tetratricopeptide repeat protein n=1 Tax=Nostoc sp. TCL26-01 TaxID=2576904 RepID=UPI0015C070FD|nr:tetratricopeptide repeat protein [Nostoc sp. TCL26-01]QLE54736.1 tetratricopeptide repeat protein [Nostoc sp. TCL26-01]